MPAGCWNFETVEYSLQYVLAPSDLCKDNVNINIIQHNKSEGTISFKILTPQCHSVITEL